MTIASPRLTLEPIDDATAKSVLEGRPNVPCGDGWPHADTLDALGKMRVGSEVWLVYREGMVIGDIGTHGAPDERGDIEIGYGLAEPHRGRGYGSEIVKALATALLERPDVLRIVAEVDDSNLPSRRALESAGFIRTSEADGLIGYEIKRRSDSSIG